MLAPRSESAALWNAFYPWTSQGILSTAWFGLARLWGSIELDPGPDRLTPYFWGLRTDGEPLPGLAEAAARISGREDRLEVDLFLRGERHVIAVEAKIGGALGRCGRYAAGSCPEVHGGLSPCRYWEPEAAFFGSLLDFGSRPTHAQIARPPCDLHYQLARTLLLVRRLAVGEQAPHLCLLLPKRRWPAMRSAWEDFAERVREDAQWRRLSVVAWEDLAELGRASRPSRM